ncbi:MAG TPA: hypothetical protein VGW12_13970 [Pyrinomonadaceae bacterium]|nr:hypothetical protein [Pyrinomonadaceae bacterium]
MIDLQTGEQTYVSRLRVRGSSLDPLVAQLRLASLFQAATVQPAGLAPSAIVLIRQLDDPRPRTVSLSNGQTTLPHEWQQSVRASIEQFARRGARPACESVGSDAPCVVFADRAELLAALAGDWYEQRAATRWWWRSLFKETIDAAALVKLWRQMPEYVPGALEHLARRHKAVPVARALAPEAARAILHNLTRRFALDELQAAVSTALQNLSRAERAAQAPAPPEAFARAATRDDFQLARPALNASDAPWQRVAPEADSIELDLPQRCLLGVGLTLQRAPAVIRSRSFLLRFNAWTGALSSGDESNAPPAPPAPKSKETPRTSMPQTDAAPKRGATHSRATVHEADGTHPESHVSFERNAQTHARDASHAGLDSPELRDTDAHAPEDSLHEAAHASPNETPQPESQDDATRPHAFDIFESEVREVETGAGAERVVELHGEEVEERAAVALQAAEVETTRQFAPPLVEAQIETRFGGLFHLVNLGLFLELYGDFTMPAAPGIALSIWDFVALLGRRLCGARVEQDAVWPLLAELAGRTVEQPPGEDFRAPDEWRIDARWLGAFPASANWRWAVARGARRERRLQVVHPQKFLVLDVPLDDAEEAEARLARELEVYAGAFSQMPERAARQFKLRGRTPLARWIERVHLYARARLSRALGIRDARRAAHLLCERHARVFVTATHIDVLMRLAELPFEVRLSGLDRDPGWIPAAGRIVAFHFE